jgi:hypothetical protein
MCEVICKTNSQVLEGEKPDQVLIQQAEKVINLQIVAVRDGHGGGWSRKINAWHLYTLMVYL